MHHYVSYEVGVGHTLCLRCSWWFFCSVSFLWSSSQTIFNHLKNWCIVYSLHGEMMETSTSGVLNSFCSPETLQIWQCIIMPYNQALLYYYYICLSYYKCLTIKHYYIIITCTVFILYIPYYYIIITYIYHIITDFQSNIIKLLLQIFFIL